MKVYLFFGSLKRATFGVLTVSVFVSVLLGCGGKRSSSESQTTVPKRLEVPVPPISLVSPEERGKYLLVHYWDKFDFADTSLIHREEYTEQAFVDYIDLFPHVDPTLREESVAALLDKIVRTDSTVFAHFTGLFERYLYDPNSPMRNEEFYLPVLRYVVNSPLVDEVGKIRPRFLLELALKNRPGSVAADFTFERPNGTKGSLRGVKSDYLVLFFNNPDCHDCARVKSLLKTITTTRVKVVAIYSDEEVELWKKTEYPAAWVNGYAPALRTDQVYDLRAIPTLYLLDKELKVVLKDVPVEVVLRYLEENKI